MEGGEGRQERKRSVGEEGGRESGRELARIRGRRSVGWVARRRAEGGSSARSVGKGRAKGEMQGRRGGWVTRVVWGHKRVGVGVEERCVGDKLDIGEVEAPGLFGGEMATIHLND